MSAILQSWYYPLLGSSQIGVDFSGVHPSAFQFGVGWAVLVLRSRPWR